MNWFSPKLLELCNYWLDYLQQRRHRVALGFFLALCLNLAIAPALHAATATLSRGNAYALGLLGLVVVGLAVYLTAVILKPEQF
ncbi:MAG: K(+)-transporting ATPase subunit F [Synechococcales bacterium]|nr:K(+)-transporting ATPase subunit F [Synechococcales bacterium]